MNSIGFGGYLGTNPVRNRSFGDNGRRSACRIVLCNSHLPPDKTIREKQLIAQAHAIVRELNIGSVTAPTRQRLSVVAKQPPTLRIVVPDAPADDR